MATTFDIARTRFALSVFGSASSSVSRVRVWRTAGLAFAADGYRATTAATYAEITGERRRVLERLVGRLNRALTNDQLPLKDFDALP